VDHSARVSMKSAA